MPHVDRSPVWLGPELRRRVEDQLGLALAEAQTTEDRVRARMLRRFVLPHYLHVLEEHRQAGRLRAQGGAGYRELTGSLDQQRVQFSEGPSELQSSVAPTDRGREPE